MKILYRFVLAVLALTGAHAARAQLIISPNDTTICPPATVTLTAAVNTLIPITTDDVFSQAVPLGFTFNFYGNNYTQCVVSANGYLSFNTSSAGAYSPWSIGSAIPGNTNVLNSVMGFWRDLYPPSGGTVSYTTIGTAPNRKFILTYCNVPFFSGSCSAYTATLQIVLFETTNIIEFHLQNAPLCTAWNSGYSIQGVQDASGTLATWTTLPQVRNYPNTWSATNDGQRYTPEGTNNFNVESIPFQFYTAATSVDWYANGTVYVGSGQSINVSPTTTTFYVAQASGNNCGASASSADTVTITVGNVVVGTTTITPITGCGYADGILTLTGLVPGTSYTINYTFGGAAQSAITQTAGSGGTLVISNIPPGTIDNVIVSQNGCSSNNLGPFVFADPPTPVISSITPALTTSCGGTDGTVTLAGLTAGASYTVSYTYNGGTPVTGTMTANGSGNIVITGPAGSYANFTVTLNNCQSALLAGPYIVNDPTAPNISSTATTNVTTCGGSDGTITLNGLTPSGTYTLSYTYGFGTAPGTPVPAGTVTANGSGAVIITGPAGTYSGIQLVQSACSSAIVGPFTLNDPPPVVINGSTITNPTTCLATDGTINFTGLTAAQVYTVTFDFNGAPQPAQFITATGTGTVTLTGGAGTYSNIILTLAACPSAVQGPFTLVDPSPILISAVNTVGTTDCGASDGKVILSGLNPGEQYQVNYLYNSITQPAVTLIADASGNLTFNAAAGTYTNIVATQSGCVSNVAGPAVVNDPPPIIIAVYNLGDPTVCGAGDGAITLIGMDPSESFQLNYIYNTTPVSVPVQSASNGTVVLTGAAGNYSNIYLSQGNCISNVAGPVTLTNPPLVADFTFSINYGCSGDTVIFNNTSTTSGVMMYAWDFRDSSAIDSAENPTHVFTTQGVYPVLLTATNGGCTDTASYLVDNTHPLSAFFTPTTDTICQGGAITFANGTIAPPHNGIQATYTWYFGDGYADSSALNINPTHTYDSAGVFTAILVATDFVPCKDTYSHTIVVDNLPYIDFTISDSVVCEGEQVALASDYQEVGNEGITWNFGDGTSVDDIASLTHAYDTGGTFTVTLTAQYRICPDTFFTRTVDVTPFPRINLGPDTAMCPGASPIPIVNIVPTSPGAFYVWSTGDSGTTSAIVATAPATYWATITANGCSNSDTVQVLNDCYLGKPNVFTPNGDGLNDYWLPRQLLGEGVSAFTLNIFNRWGQLVYQTDKLDGRGWDGRMNDGQYQPQGVYVYQLTVQFKNGQRENVNGNVTLLR